MTIGVVGSKGYGDAKQAWKPAIRTNEQIILLFAAASRFGNLRYGAYENSQLLFGFAVHIYAK